MDTFSELLAARSGPLEHVLSLLSRTFNALMFLLPSYHHCSVFTFSFQPFNYYR